MMMNLDYDYNYGYEEDYAVEANKEYADLTDLYFNGINYLVTDCGDHYSFVTNDGNADEYIVNKDTLFIEGLENAFEVLVYVAACTDGVTEMIYIADEETDLVIFEAEF